MKRTIPIRCHSCGSRAEVFLTDSEIENLRTRGYITRVCSVCRGQTQWDATEVPAPAHLAKTEGEEEKGATILLIDDDTDVLTVLEKVLNRANFELESATSARAAVTLLARTDYDVILSDIRMPDFDGKMLFQFLEENMPEYKQRVIFLTGDTGTPATMEFLEEVKRPYLVKPIDIPELLDLIRQTLSEPKE